MASPKRCRPEGRRYIGSFWRSGEEDGGFGFDDEEGVGGRVAGVAKLLDGIVERGGQDGEDDGAVEAADEVEAGFLLDELEWGRHF